MSSGLLRATAAIWIEHTFNTLSRLNITPGMLFLQERWPFKVILNSFALSGWPDVFCVRHELKRQRDKMQIIIKNNNNNNNSEQIESKGICVRDRENERVEAESGLPVQISIQAGMLSARCTAPATAPQSPSRRLPQQRRGYSLLKRLRQVNVTENQCIRQILSK